MEFTENATTGDLLAEISRLEDHVSKLSSQMESHHETIRLLQQSLTDRDLRIHELESSLVITPKFLLQNTLDKIHQCKTQIKNGIDEKIINPVIAQIRQQIQFVQHLADESKDFINKSKQIIQHNIDASTQAINKSPNQARSYIEKNIVEPILSLIHQVIETVNSHIKTSHQLMVQKIILPFTSFYEQSIEAVLALPSQSHILFQVWAVEPVRHTLHQLTDSGSSLPDNLVNGLKHLLARLINFIGYLIDILVEQVKKSPFWDGKRNIEALT